MVIKKLFNKWFLKKKKHFPEKPFYWKRFELKTTKRSLNITNLHMLPTGICFSRRPIALGHVAWFGWEPWAVGHIVTKTACGLSGLEFSTVKRFKKRAFIFLINIKY